MQRIMTHLNLPQYQYLHVVTIKKYILKHIAQNIIEIAGESIDKASRNLNSMYRSDDQNIKVYKSIYIYKIYKICKNI